MITISAVKTAHFTGSESPRISRTIRTIFKSLSITWIVG